MAKPSRHAPDYSKYIQWPSGVNDPDIDFRLAAECIRRETGVGLRKGAPPIYPYLVCQYLAYLDAALNAHNIKPRPIKEYSIPTAKQHAPIFQSLRSERAVLGGILENKFITFGAWLRKHGKDIGPIPWFDWIEFSEVDLTEASEPIGRKRHLTPLKRSDKTNRWLSEALLILRDHPEQSVPDIAQIVGKHPSTLYRNETFKTAREQAAKYSAAKYRPPSESCVQGNEEDRHTVVRDDDGDFRDNIDWNADGPVNLQDE